MSAKILLKCVYIVLKLTLDDRYLRAVNDLHAATATNNSTRTAPFEKIIRNKIFILDGHAQTCGTAIECDDVITSAKSL